jgi:hypothetical protein
MITIAWSTQTTERNPEGGDSVHMVIGELLIDGTVAEQYSYEAHATTHPIERSAEVTDHIRVGLTRLELNCRVSNDPYDERLQEDEHVQNVLDTILSLINDRRPVDADTDRGVYENYAILNMSDMRDETTGDGAAFTLTLQEIVLVDIEDADAPSPRVERGRRRVDRGSQRAEDTGSQETNVSRSPEQRTTAMIQITEALTDLAGGGSTRQSTSVAGE